MVQRTHRSEAPRPVHPSVERRDDVTVARDAGVLLSDLHLLRLQGHQTGGCGSQENLCGAL